MDDKTYFNIKKEMTNYCYKGVCDDECLFHIMNNGMHVNCKVLEFDYPDKAEEIVKDYLKNKFPEGYVICIRTHKAESVYKCNKYDSCTECMSENS